MTANATRRTLLAATVFAAVLLSCGQPFSRVQAADGPKAFIDGTGLGWTPSGKDDFIIEDADKDLWTWKDDILRSHGKASLCRSKKVYTNFELVLDWRLHTNAGNSGIFIRAEEKSVKSLKPRGVPTSMESLLRPGDPWRDPSVGQWRRDLGRDGYYPALGLLGTGALQSTPRIFPQHPYSRAALGRTKLGAADSPGPTAAGDQTGRL